MDGSAQEHCSQQQIMEKEPADKRWREFKTFGFLPPREENRIIFYALLLIIVLTVLYIASYYLKR